MLDLDKNPLGNVSSSTLDLGFSASEGSQDAVSSDGLGFSAELSRAQQILSPKPLESKVSDVAERTSSAESLVDDGSLPNTETSNNAEKRILELPKNVEQPSPAIAKTEEPATGNFKIEASVNLSKNATNPGLTLNASKLSEPQTEASKPSASIQNVLSRDTTQAQVRDQLQVQTQVQDQTLDQTQVQVQTLDQTKVQVQSQIQEQVQEKQGVSVATNSTVLLSPENANENNNLNKAPGSAQNRTQVVSARALISDAGPIDNLEANSELEMPKIGTKNSDRQPVVTEQESVENNFLIKRSSDTNADNKTSPALLQAGIGREPTAPQATRNPLEFGGAEQSAKKLPASVQLSGAAGVNVGTGIKTIVNTAPNNTTDPISDALNAKTLPTTVLPAGVVEKNSVTQSQVGDIDSVVIGNAEIRTDKALPESAAKSIPVEVVNRSETANEKTAVSGLSKVIEGAKLEAQSNVNDAAFKTLNLDNKTGNGANASNQQDQQPKTINPVIAAKAEKDLALAQMRASATSGSSFKAIDVTLGQGNRKAIQQSIIVDRTPLSSVNTSVDTVSSNVYHATSTGIITANSSPLNSGLAGNFANAPGTLFLGQPGAEQTFTDNVRWMVNEKLSRATVNVSPANLGPITVSVDLESQNMNVSIIANNTMAKEAIDSLMPRMREHFSNEGYQQVSVDVSSQQERQSGTSDQSNSSFQHDERHQSEQQNDIESSQGHSDLARINQRSSDSLVDTYA